MRIIGVVDLLRGRAVHAVAGARERYQPVAPPLDMSMVAGDGEALSRFYVERLGVDALYVADLDAIQGGTVQGRPIARLCALGVSVFADAGVSTIDATRDLLALGVSRIIVGSETLSSFEDLDAICAAVGGERVVFSLDLRKGEVIARIGPPKGGPYVHGATAGPHLHAKRAVDAGVGGVIVIDLARVGTGAGLDLDLVASVRDAVPSHAMLLAGGGVRGWNDLVQLAEAGCDGALVATALQNGRVSARDVQRARGL